MLYRDRQVMKRCRYAGGIVSITLILAFILNLTGCGRFGSDKSLAKKEAEEIFRMIRDEDIEGLSSKFSGDSLPSYEKILKKLQKQKEQF